MELVDVSERAVKDGNGKRDIYTGKCRMKEGAAFGRRILGPTRHCRMEYRDKRLYEGLWDDGMWHGDGTFTRRIT